MKFKGYYFRHQNKDTTVAFIVGKADDGAFIQVICDTWSRIFNFSDIKFGKTIIIGDNTFSREGIHINLPGINGDIRYFDTTPLRSDIMGIFKFFPMECRHMIISMRHRLQGNLMIDGNNVCFDDGVGYIEGDSGRSFPERYFWLHANDFEDRTSFFLSIAKIPFCKLHFEGVICVVIHEGKEYRLATYLGAKSKINGTHFSVKQHDLLLEGEILSQGEGFSLSSPQNGIMSGIIKEHNNASFSFKLTKKGKTVCQGTSTRAGYEKVNYQ